MLLGVLGAEGTDERSPSVVNTDTDMSQDFSPPSCQGGRTLANTGEAIFARLPVCCMLAPGRALLTAPCA
jgi:hypothetical protein